MPVITLSQLECSAETDTKQLIYYCTLLPKKNNEFQSETLTEFQEIWYEEYAIEGHSKSVI
jgi:hypothetical protein